MAGEWLNEWIALSILDSFNELEANKWYTDKISVVITNTILQTAFPFEMKVFINIIATKAWMILNSMCCNIKFIIIKTYYAAGFVWFYFYSQEHLYSDRCMLQ